MKENSFKKHEKELDEIGNKLGKSIKGLFDTIGKACIDAAKEAKKQEDKYNRLIVKMQPYIDTMCYDLSTFSNPSVEEATTLLANAITINVEAMKNLGIQEVNNG